MKSITITDEYSIEVIEELMDIYKLDTDETVRKMVDMLVNFVQQAEAVQVQPLHEYQVPELQRHSMDGCDVIIYDTP